MLERINEWVTVKRVLAGIGIFYAAVLAIGVTIGSCAPPATQPLPPRPTAVPTQVATPAPLPTQTPMPAPTPTPDGFSSESLELLSYFHELVKVKDADWFHELCYAQSSPAHNWMKYGRSKKGLGTVGEAGVLFGEIIQMGHDYCNSQGQETTYTRSMTKNMKTAWLHFRPVPTPLSSFVITDRPYQDIATRTAACIWNTPAMHSMFQGALATVDTESKFAALIELAVETEATTMGDTYASLVLCQSLRE